MPFLAALHFLTTIPLTPRCIFTQRELGRSLAFYPIVGVVIGSVLIGMQFVASLLFNATASEVFVLAAWALITGGLHLDGFMDACDGLFSRVGERVHAQRVARGRYANAKNAASPHSATAKPSTNNTPEARRSKTESVGLCAS